MRKSGEGKIGLGREIFSFLGLLKNPFLPEINSASFWGFQLSFFLKIPIKGNRLPNFWGNFVMENIVTAKELAGFLKLTEATIYKLASSGELPGFKIGDSWRFDMDEVMKLFHKQQNRKKG